MPAPKRRAGESLTSYNRRLVAYTKNNNRKTLEDAFNDTEEDVDIWDLGTPKKKTGMKDRAKQRYLNNASRYYEDRMKSSKPSGKNIWKGLTAYNMTPKDTKGSYNKQLVENKNAKATPFLEESASSSKGNRTPRKSETKNERDGELKNATQVLEEGFSERADKSSPVAVASPMGKRVLTPGDYTSKIGGKRVSIEDVEDPIAKKNGKVLTPGDYTKNIGKRKTGKGEDPISTRSKDSEYVYDDFEVDDSWRRDNNGSVRVSGGKVTPKNDEVRHENDDGREIDTGLNRRPRRVAEGGKGIKQNGPTSSLSEDRILGGEDRIYGGEDRVLGGDNSPRRTSNNFDSGRVGYVTEDDAPKKRPANWITTRDGKIAEANSTQTETKGEKRSARPGGSTRSILEDGFRNNQKKEKRASGKVASFRGIRP